jgi:hypothetical protein
MCLPSYITFMEFLFISQNTANCYATLLVQFVTERSILNENINFICKTKFCSLFF